MAKLTLMINEVQKLWSFGANWLTSGYIKLNRRLIGSAMSIFPVLSTDCCPYPCIAQSGGLFQRLIVFEQRRWCWAIGGAPEGYTLMKALKAKVMSSMCWRPLQRVCVPGLG